MTRKRHKHNKLRGESWLDRVPEELQPPAPESPRGRILAAARARFARDGFGTTSMRSVAIEAGVNQAMIHYYFGSKQALYERVLAVTIIEVLAAIYGNFSRTGETPLEQLLQLPVRITQIFLENPVRLHLLRREVGAGAVRMQKVIRRLGSVGPIGFREALTHHVAETQARHEVVDVDPLVLVQFLMIHTYGGLFIEPVMRVATGAPDNDDGYLLRVLSSQRDLLRRALASKSEDRR